ncbi:efflux RND transporter periplasmic adaptor subunit [Brevundimonas goettingensis]|nr:efflux RND transporter periplasmic adaptor subunit [Brevundimonas goettingensis]
MTAAAIVAALGLGLGGGYGLARLNTAPAPDAHGEEEGHGEEAHVEGVVALTPEAAAKAGVSVIAVGRGGGAELTLPGRIAFAPGAEAVVDAPLPGQVVRVHVGVGQGVSAGSPLVTLRSPEGAASRATTDAAEAAAEAARAALRRDRSLFEQGYVAKARLDITEAEARRAEAELRAARARVGAYGAPGADGLVVVRSPVAGVVTRMATAPGQVLHEEDQEVAAVADARRLELAFEAPPQAAALLGLGARVEARTGDGRMVAGTVVAIAPANASGVVMIRARIDGATAPAGTVVSARLMTIAANSGNVLTVPSEAVQTVEGRPSVFVVEEGGFHARPVTTGAISGGRTEITSGLTGSERIAGTGAFLLKAELAKGEAGHED